MNCPIRRCASLPRGNPRCTDYACIEISRLGAKADIGDWDYLKRSDKKWFTSATSVAIA